MKRKTFDALLISLGLTMKLVLVAAGGLLTWALRRTSPDWELFTPPGTDVSEPAAVA